MDDIINDDNESLNNFNITFQKIMCKMNLNYNVNANASESDRDIERERCVPDKWDIAAGLIIAGVLSISIIGLAITCYYIAISLYSSNVIIGSIISLNSTKNEIINEYTKQFKDLFINSLSIKDLSSATLSELKEYHEYIKIVLIKRFT